MKNRWRQLVERYAALQPREQILIAAAVLVLVAVLCDWLLWAPQRAQAKRLDQQIAETQAQLDTLGAQQQETQRRLAADPDAELKAQIDAVRARIAAQDVELGRLMVDLVPPDAMAAVLRDVLMKRRQLRLVALANSPAQPAFGNDAAAPATPDPAAVPASDSPLPAVYRHGLSLTFRGSYFDVVEYLRALVTPGTDSAGRRFFWESIDYKVERYPEAEVTLKVYTLGNKEAWIGA